MANKDKKWYIPWIGVGVSALILGAIGRFSALKFSGDIGTANLVFFIILAGAVLLYLLFQELVEQLFSILFKRIKIQQQPDTRLPEESVLQQKIDAFCRYSDTVLTGYVAEDDLKILHKCIEQYAKGQIRNTGSPQIKTQGIDKFDLCHYGWNAWNHFAVAQQPETAQWLIHVFQLLEDSDPSTLYKKFTHNERYTYKIAREEKIK